MDWRCKLLVIKKKQDGCQGTDECATLKVITSIGDHWRCYGFNGCTAWNWTYCYGRQNRHYTKEECWLMVDICLCVDWSDLEVKLHLDLLVWNKSEYRGLIAVAGSWSCHTVRSHKESRLIGCVTGKSCCRILYRLIRSLDSLDVLPWRKAEWLKCNAACIEIQTIILECLFYDYEWILSAKEFFLPGGAEPHCKCTCLLGVMWTKIMCIFFFQLKKRPLCCALEMVHVYDVYCFGIMG